VAAAYPRRHLLRSEVDPLPERRRNVRLSGASPRHILAGDEPTAPVAWLGDRTQGWM